MKSPCTLRDDWNGHVGLRPLRPHRRRSAARRGSSRSIQIGGPM